MHELFASGRVVDAILAFMLLEWAVLSVWHARAPRGLRSPRGLVWSFAAGASLLIALRCALLGTDWAWIAVFLAIALIVHVVDVERRLRGRD